MKFAGFQTRQSSSEFGMARASRRKKSMKTRTLGHMKMKQLGNSDLFITPVGFGAWAIGSGWEFAWGAQDDNASIAAIHRALELGSTGLIPQRSMVPAIRKKLWPARWRVGELARPASLCLHQMWSALGRTGESPLRVEGRF